MAVLKKQTTYYFENVPIIFENYLSSLVAYISNSWYIKNLNIINLKLQVFKIG